MNSEYEYSKKFELKRENKVENIKIWLVYNKNLDTFIIEGEGKKGKRSLVGLQGNKVLLTAGLSDLGFTRAISYDKKVKVEVIK